MRIRRDGGDILIRDRVAPFWALGLFLLAGGVLAVAMPLGLATNAGELETWERLASIAVGLGVSTGALWWLGRSPSTQVHLDLTRRCLRLVRSGLGGRQVRRLSFDDLERVEVEQGNDSEGGTVWRPAVRLGSGELVLLSELWSHDHAGVEKGVSIVAEAWGRGRNGEERPVTWTDLRDRWEYSHLWRAVLAVLSLIALAIAIS